MAVLISVFTKKLLDSYKKSAQMMGRELKHLPPHTLTEFR
jgi:hypothetical protein